MSAPRSYPAAAVVCAACGRPSITRHRAYNDPAVVECSPPEWHGCTRTDPAPVIVVEEGSR